MLHFPPVLGFTPLYVFSSAQDGCTKISERFIHPKISRNLFWLTRLASNQNAEKDCRITLWLVLKLTKSPLVYVVLLC